MSIVLVQRAVIKTSPLISNWSVSLFCAQNSRLSCLFESIERSCQLFTANLREGVTNYFARVPLFWTKFATLFLTLIFGVSQGAPTDHLEEVMIFGFSRGLLRGVNGGRGGPFEKKWFVAHPSYCLIVNKFLIQLKPCSDKKWESAHFSWHTDKPTHIQGVPKMHFLNCRFAKHPVRHHFIIIVYQPYLIFVIFL